MARARLRRPGRLPSVAYVGIQRYFLTLCTAERREWFKERVIVEQVLLQLFARAATESFSIPAYCVMPDHLHLLAEGTTVESRLERFVSSFKQKTGFAFLKQCRARLWQDGYYDRIVRDDEETLAVVRYILDNPVRKGLVSKFNDYPFSGSDRYSLEELAASCSQG
jgi:putative transposase